VPLGDPEFGVTPLPQTEAQIRQRDAAAGVSNARAGVLRVQEAAGGWNPNTGRGRGKLPMTQPEAEAKMQWINAQAAKKAAAGESPEFVNAWSANEMVKAGLPVPQEADFSGVTGGATTVPLGSDGVPAPRPPGGVAAVPAGPGLPGIGAPAGGGLPATALAQLIEGEEVQFGNGQVWTLVNGQPKRVR
jgi:hypothetical protein